MCASIEYVRDGERIAVYFDSNSPELPVRERGVANPQEAAPSELPIYRLLRPMPMDTQPQLK